MRLLARAFALSLFISAPAIAQAVSPAGVTRYSTVADTNTVQRRADYRFATRTLTAALGGTVGAFGLGLAGASLAPDCGGCEDPGLREFLAGFVIGGVVGAGVGAALPRFGGDKCSLGGRIWRGIGGAAVGSTAGALIGNTIGETSLAIGWSVGGALGAPLALIGC